MEIYILGAGGFGREVAFIISEYLKRKQEFEQNSSVKLIGFIDDDPNKKNKEIAGLPVLGDFEHFRFKNTKESFFVCSIGNVNLRKKLINQALELGLKPYNPVLFPNVVCSQFNAIGKGTVICPSCVLTVDIVIGDHVHIHSDSTIGHDVAIGDYANISPGVHLCGGCTVEEGADIGTGANILPGVRVGEYAIVGAGALVNKDVSPGTTVVGIPAKPR